MMDKRTRAYKQAQKKAKVLKCYVAVAILGALAGCILTVSLYKPQGLVSPKPESRVVKVVEAQQTPWCYDPISCIRDIGEQMGFSNQEIMLAIRIAKCESGLNPQALVKEPNGTYSLGVMQINDVHGKRISRQDRLDFIKNIQFAWNLRQEQGGWTAWSCYRKVKNL